MNQAYPKRSMQAGTWYWASKRVVQECTSKIGFTAAGVYHFLASMVDENQRCYPSQQFIADRLGCSRATVNKAIQRLKTHHLIRVTKNNGKNCIYELTEVSCKGNKTKLSNKRNYVVNHTDTNKNQRTRINNNKVGINKRKNTQKIYFQDFEPTTKEDLLAQDITTALEDYERLYLYRSFAQKYPEHVLRSILSEVKQTPAKNIKKSRAAFFCFLVKKYAQKGS